MAVKKKLFAYAWWLVLGIFGAHRLYLGRPISGAVFPGLWICLVIVVSNNVPTPVGELILFSIIIWTIVDAFLIPGMVRAYNNRPIDTVGAVSRQDEIRVRFIEPQPSDEPKQSQVEHAMSVAGDVHENAPPSEITEHSFDDDKEFNECPDTDESVTPPGVYPKRYEVEYADANGVVTTRTIDVWSVTAEPHAIYIEVWCHMASDWRTFRADRILKAWQAGSDEPIDDVEEHFYNLLPEEDRPDPDHDAVMSRVAPGLGLLVWIANADREITADETAILLAFIDERNGLAGAKFAQIPWNKVKASVWIDRARPTLNSSAGVLRKISRTGREYAMIRRYAEQLANEGGSSAQNRMRQLFQD